MAKAKAAAPTEAPPAAFLKEKPEAKGYKNCNLCGGWIRGMQTKVCPGCGGDVTPQAKASTATAPRQQKHQHHQQQQPSKEAAMLFALKAGGIDQAEILLEDLGENPAMLFAIAAGGIDEAKAQLEELKQALL